MFKIIKKCVLPLVCVLVSFHGFAADILKGDQKLANESFSFPIKAHVSSLYGNNVYVGAHSNQTGGGVAKNFALAGLSHGDTEFTPLAPEKIKLNGQENKNNPLFDTGIQLLSLIDQGADEAEHPVVVAENDPSTIYLFGRLTNSENLELASKQALVAPATPTSGIEQLVAGPRGHIFAAVKSAGAGTNFGDIGSGIAYFLFGTIDKSLAFEQVETVPLDVTSNELKINPADNDVTINSVTMHFNPDLGLLYVGLQVQAALISGGARAVVVGRIENNSLVFAPIAALNVFAGGNQIVGTGVVGASVSIHEVKSMVTSTVLPYIIVRGGNGGAGATRNKIFALPLVSGNNNSALNGTIADKNEDPNPITHSIIKPATAQAEMPTDADAAVVVGGQELNVGGNITEMFVQGDSVFAQVDGNGGVFYSQALFDTKGKIKGWTSWRRFAGVTDPVFGASLKRSTAELTFLTGADENNVTTVKRTTWSRGSGQGTLPLNNTIGSLGGICGLFNFNPATPALHDISLLIATDSDGVLLGETGRVVGGFLVPNQGAVFNAVQTFNNGAITQNLGGGGNPKIVIIKGGVLEEVGPITAAEIARDGAGGNNGWLFCGGCNGLAVLSKADGTGWDPTANELGVGFDGFADNMSFKKIGDYFFVRKVVSDGNFLYVLTDTQLDRIDLTQGNAGLGNLSVTTLATYVQLTGNPDFGSLQDLIVSGKFALLATSEGLFRVGDGNDIRAAASSAAVGWTHVVIPEGSGPVTNLFVVSKTDRAQDVARMGGGQVYVLVADRGKNRAQVNRFAISDVSVAAIDGDTIVPFPDFFVQGITSYFANLGEFRDLFVTDGANNFHARAKELEQLANLKLLPASIETRIGGGFNFLGARSVLVPVSLEESTAIATMVNNSAAGTWVVGDDRGVQVNE